MIEILGTSGLLEVLSWTGAVVVLITFLVKTLTPLRMLAMLSNIIFVNYAIILGLDKGFDGIWSIIILHCLLFPLNAFRLYQMRCLVREVSEAATNQDIIKHLIPFMEKESLAKDTVIFCKGDNADRMFFIQNGNIQIPEIGKTLETGSIFGEVGIFSPNSRRSAGAVCTSDCELYTIKRDKMLELYYQKPAFGFFIVRILSDHIEENVNALLEMENKI
tara:strand:- start:667 stop:1323 length:657 start_codon:yes stop_codon:yes gene_type:complete